MRIFFTLLFLLFYPTKSIAHIPSTRDTYSVASLLKERYDNPDSISHLSTSHKQIAKFYAERGFKPIWFTGFKLNSAGKNAIFTLKNAALEGLNPSDYLPAIKGISFLELNLLSPEIIVENEIRLTKYIASYLRDLKGGRLAPQKITKQAYQIGNPVNPYDLLSKGMLKDPTGIWLTCDTLSEEAYKKLKDKLANLRILEQKGGWSLLSFPTQIKIKLGVRGSFIQPLKNQLFARGYLDEISQTDLFDEKVDKALRQFQSLHGLEEDGVLGSATLAALNVPIEKRINQIIISMERWRWLPEEKGERYVMVNIPAYHLKAFDKSQLILEMPVIIGMNYRQTPVFTSVIDFVRFNPTWYVPYSISVKDKLPLLRSNPSYFNEKGYRIYNELGENINPEEIDWTDVDSTSFNYKIVQKPGPTNALGRLFFHINTPFGVFLHGTPNIESFRNAKRSLSSGCIRVADPIMLAFFILNDPQKWPKEKIIQWVEKGETQNIYLEQPVKIYVTYHTAWVDQQGRCHFAEDIYNQDHALQEALDKKSFEYKTF
jgi:murein L,D-transpeptidase YcbB/YkuD